MILVSACLVGVNCRYDGKNCKDEKLIEFLKDKEYIIVCPEQLGGLATPRLPSEITSKETNTSRENVNVINSEDEDVTDNFLKGASETLKVADLYDVKTAILKARSPSCGSEYIYNGEFNGKLKKGVGVTAEALKKKGILVLNEENYRKVL